MSNDKISCDFTVSNSLEPYRKNTLEVANTLSSISKGQRIFTAQCDSTGNTDTSRGFTSIPASGTTPIIITLVTPFRYPFTVTVTPYYNSTFTNSPKTITAVRTPLPNTIYVYFLSITDSTLQNLDFFFTVIEN